MILPIGVISITYVHRYMCGFRIVDKLKLRGVNFNRNCAKQTLSVCKYEIPEEFLVTELINLCTFNQTCRDFGMCP